MHVKVGKVKTETLDKPSSVMAVVFLFNSSELNSMLSRGWEIAQLVECLLSVHKVRVQTSVPCRVPLNRITQEWRSYAFIS